MCLGFRTLDMDRHSRFLRLDGFFPNDVSSCESQFGLPNVPIQTVLLDDLDGTAGEGEARGGRFRLRGSL